MNKKPDSLDNSDLTLRRSSGVGMESGVKQVVLRVCGFEMFNTRPYHNYETWSDGYRVVGRADQAAMTLEEVASILHGVMGKHDVYIEAEAEDLDDACRLFADRLKARVTT